MSLHAAVPSHTLQHGSEIRSYLVAHRLEMPLKLVTEESWAVCAGVLAAQFPSAVAAAVCHVCMIHESYGEVLSTWRGSDLQYLHANEHMRQHHHTALQSMEGTSIVSPSGVSRAADATITRSIMYKKDHVALQVITRTSPACMWQV